MNVNDNIKQIIKDNNIPPGICVAYLWSLEHNDVKSLDLLYEALGEDWQKVNILLTTKDDETGKMIPKYKLEEVMQSDFDKFMKLLFAKNLNTYGHINNQADYSIWGGEEDEKSFNLALQKIGNLEKLVDIVVGYYKTATFKMKLANYLTSNALIADANQ